MAILQLDSFLIKLYRLARRLLDVSVLSIGIQIARSAGSLLFWVIIGFFAFFLFLALNIAAGFALATLVNGSPLWGFLYLALGYLGLILLTLLLRSWLLHCVRQAIARRVLERARKINDQLDRMTPEISYQSSLDRPEGEVPYTALQRGLGRSLVERSRSTEEVLRDVRYIKENYKGMLAKTAQREAMNYATQLPGVSSVLHFFGYKGDLGRHRRPSHTKVSKPKSSFAKALETHAAGLVKYAPYALIAWDFLRPTLMSIAIGQLQHGLHRLFTRRKHR